MQIKVVDLNNAFDSCTDTQECMSVIIFNGDEKFTISKGVDDIEIRVDGRLWIEPIASNAVKLNEGK